MTAQFDQANGGTAAQIGQFKRLDSRPQGTAADDHHLALGHCRWQRIYFVLADPDLIDLLDLGPHEHGLGAGAPRPGI